MTTELTPLDEFKQQQNRAFIAFKFQQKEELKEHERLHIERLQAEAARAFADGHHVSFQYLVRKEPMELLVKLAASEKLTPFVAETLNDYRNEAVGVALASNKATPVSVLNKLARDLSKTTRAAVASNESAEAATLAVLARDNAPTVAMTVVSNPSINEETLQMFATHDNHVWRALTARSPGLTEAIAMKLAKDSNRAVRVTLAKNEAATERALEILAKDRAQDVRMFTANNPSTSLSVLEKLACDRAYDVRKIVAQRAKEFPLEDEMLLTALVASCEATSKANAQEL